MGLRRSGLRMTSWTMPCAWIQKGVRTCHGVMERVRPAGEQEPDGVWDAEWVAAVWPATVRVRGLVDSVSVLPAERSSSMESVSRAIHSSARVVVHR